MSAETDGGLQDFLENNLASISRIADRARGFTREQLSQMGTEEFDTAILPNVDLEQTLALTEGLRVVIGGGLTPLNTPQGIPTVEGLSRLHAAFVQAVRDGKLVDLEVRVKAAELEKALDTITTTRGLVVKAEQARAQTDTIQAQRDTQLAFGQAKTDTVVNEITQETRLLREVVTNKQERVKIASISKSADIDAEVLKLKKQAEAIKKRRAARRERAQALVGPYKRRAKISLIVLVCIANLVADTPGREQTFLLGRVNRMWDAVYTPLRDGVLNTYHNVRPDAQSISNS